jgi:hypothetical protein
MLRDGNVAHEGACDAGTASTLARIPAVVDRAASLDALPEGVRAR